MHKYGDHEDIEIMISVFDQQNSGTIIEIYFEVDIVSCSNISLQGGAVCSCMSSGQNLSSNEGQALTIMQRVAISDDDDDDNNYIVSNSFAKKTSEEEDVVDGDSTDTNDEATPF